MLLLFTLNSLSVEEENGSLCAICFLPGGPGLNIPALVKQLGIYWLLSILKYNHKTKAIFKTPRVFQLETNFSYLEKNILTE